MTHSNMGFTPHYTTARFWVIIHSPTDSQPPSRRGGFFVSTVDLLNRPTGMFRDEWFSIFGGSLQSCKGGWITDIPQRDTDIPQQSSSSGAQHRCAGEALFESGFLQGK